MFIATNSFHTQTVKIKPDEYCYNHLDYLVEDFQDALHEVFPSVYACNRWIDKERQAIAHNRFADFGITIKNNTVAIFVTPKPVPKLQLPLRNAWIKRIENTFKNVAKSTFVPSVQQS